MSYSEFLKIFDLTGKLPWLASGEDSNVLFLVQNKVGMDVFNLVYTYTKGEFYFYS